MKFKLIEKEKRGFARYCPTFAKAYDCMREGLRRRTLAKSVPKLARDLLDDEVRVRRSASGVLSWIAQTGVKITAAIPALVKALDDENSDIMAVAAGALGAAAEKGADVTAAISALGKALGKAVGCENADVREIVAKALEKTAHNGDQKTRTLVVNEIIGFMRSDWFQDEMWKNSVIYEKNATEIARLLAKLKESEEEAA